MAYGPRFLVLLSEQQVHCWLVSTCRVSRCIKVPRCVFEEVAWLRATAMMLSSCLPTLPNHSHPLSWFSIFLGIIGQYHNSHLIYQSTSSNSMKEEWAPWSTSRGCQTMSNFSLHGFSLEYLRSKVLGLRGLKTWKTFPEYVESWLLGSKSSLGTSWCKRQALIITFRDKHANLRQVSSVGTRQKIKSL